MQKYYVNEDLIVMTNHANVKVQETPLCKIKSKPYNETVLIFFKLHHTSNTSKTNNSISECGNFLTICRTKTVFSQEKSGWVRKTNYILYQLKNNYIEFVVYKQESLDKKQEINFGQFILVLQQNILITIIKNTVLM